MKFCKVMVLMKNSIYDNFIISKHICGRAAHNLVTLDHEERWYCDEHYKPGLHEVIIVQAPDRPPR